VLTDRTEDVLLQLVVVPEVSDTDEIEDVALEPADMGGFGIEEKSVCPRLLKYL
jgi:hypothetical protein